VADSLYRRLDETTTSDPLLAIEAWLHANRLILDFVRRHPGRCLLRELGQVTADPRGTVAAVRRDLGVPLGKPPACFDPALLEGDQAVIEEQAELVRVMFPEAETLYDDLRREAGSVVPLPARHRRSLAEPRRAAAVAAVTAWARGRRTFIHAHAAHKATVEATAARDAALQAAARATTAAEEAREALAREAALVRTEAAREVATVRAEAEAEIAAVRAELSQVTAYYADTTRKVLDQATGVAAPKPKMRTVDKLRRKASRLVRQARRIVRQARRIVREQVHGTAQGRP
jgi:hypothetical protein